MKKYLFLNAEDRRPAEESDYRYKKSKPVTAMKAKRDEEGFFIPWAMFRPIGEKGLLCELFGANPIRMAADLRMNRDLLMKEAYEHEVELLMCHIRASELWMQQEFCIGHHTGQVLEGLGFFRIRPLLHRDVDPAGGDHIVRLVLRGEVGKGSGGKGGEADGQHRQNQQFSLHCPCSSLAVIRKIPVRDNMRIHRS